MRALSRTALAGLAALLFSVSACSDDASDPFAPEPTDGIQKDFGTIDFLPPPDPAELVGITAGGFHTCVYRRDGRTYCWGRDDEGQVGRSPTANCSTGILCVERPRLVFSAAAQVDAGYNHTCAVANSKAGFCWGGSRPYGQVGTGQFSEYFAPQVISGSLTLTSISAGMYSTCATTTTGMYCWGQLGGPASAPARISSYNGYHKVSVGYVHACALTNEWGLRPVDCWGGNTYGQAGFDRNAALLPFTIRTGAGGNVNNVATEENFTCVDQGNTTVQCFGDNQYGTLGNGNNATTHVPQTVGGGMALGGVSTSANHACALDPNGAGFCWGNGWYGQLGNSIQVNSNTPVGVAMPYNTRFTAIAAGKRHTCAIGVPIRIRVLAGSPIPQTVYCWGDNTYGQLGRGIWTPDGTPMRPLPTTALE